MKLTLAVCALQLLGFLEVMVECFSSRGQNENSVFSLSVEGFTCRIMKLCSYQVFASTVMVFLLKRNLSVMTLRFTVRENK